METCHLCLLLIHISLTKAYENEMFEYKGWRPLTREEAYKGLLTVPKLNFIQNIQIPEEYTEYSAGNHQEFRNEVIKLVEPQEVFREFVIKREELSHPEKNKHTNEFSGKQNQCGRDVENCAETQNDITKIIIKSENYEVNDDVKANQNARKAKIIEDDDSTLNVNKLKSVKKKSFNGNNNTGITFIKEAMAESSNTYYEVTENSGTADLVREANDGYVYNEPETNLSKDNYSITNIFSDILTKYNIKNNDKLLNYEISRAPNKRISLNRDFIYLPIPIDYVRRHNSLNHKPVNPILAVLLSNYGYYLPGLYGLHNNYKNLYGYLASNNIHNNRPFGTYKIFSDTDSSNK